MHGKDLFVNDSCNRQAIEAVCECLPQLYVISSLTLVVEPVYAVDRSAFVVTPQNEEIFWIFYLVSKEQADGLQ